MSTQFLAETTIKDVMSIIITPAIKHSKCLEPQTEHTLV